MELKEKMYYRETKNNGKVELTIKTGDIFVEEVDLFMDGGWPHFTNFYVVLKISPSGKTIYLNELGECTSTLIKTEANGVCNWDYWKVNVTNILVGDTFSIRTIVPMSIDSFCTTIPSSFGRQRVVLKRFDDSKVYYKTLFS